jgi:Flp pilus assembly protein TadD
MSTPKPPPSRPARWRVAFVGVVLLALAGAGVAFWWHVHRQPLPPEDPRLSFPTPYRNVRPEVQYVGDEACAGCHRSESEAFRQHPMGRSLAAVGSPRPAALLDARPPADFEVLGFRYAAERRGDRLLHRETVPGPDGEPGDVVEAEVRYVLGSGTRGESYLVEQDGYLFQSPLSWYREKAVWDLAPGYQERHQHFDRPVIGACLFCHCNRAEPVEGIINRYREPVFRGEAIGCERCHGPGELHVRQQRLTGDRDDTIVNPRHLEPALREAVCEQCHLQGQIRVLPRGRQEFDYRPGLPLEPFWAVFELATSGEAERKAVGQVEQMHQSRCYRDSGGQLGCTSCHDPHRKPAEQEKVAYYRGRCDACHHDRGCALPAPARQEKGDDCAACHLPRLASADIIHVAASDHRVLRKPSPGAADLRPPGPPADNAPLVPFHAERVRPGDPEAARDLGVALAGIAGQAAAGPARDHFGELALPLLEEATRAHPDDVAAWEWLGAARRYTDRPKPALAAYEAALALAPQRERALAEAGMAAGQLGRTDDAVRYWRGAVAVNPRRWRYHYELAQLLSEEDRAEALRECEAALRLNPASTDTRMVQVACLVDAGRKEEARAAFARLLALKPPREQELRQWFARQVP